MTVLLQIFSVPGECLHERPSHIQITENEHALQVPDKDRRRHRVSHRGPNLQEGRLVEPFLHVRADLRVDDAVRPPLA